MSYTEILAQTYLDSCNIFRHEKVDVQGITHFVEILKYSGIRCALSRGSLAKATGTNATEISTSSKIFFKPDTDIQEGDKLIITQQGASYSKVYKVGEVFPYYGSHIEVMVTRSDKV